MANVGRCNKKYGSGLICKRLANHTGRHAVRLTVQELQRIMLNRQNKRFERTY